MLEQISFLVHSYPGSSWERQARTFSMPRDLGHKTETAVYQALTMRLIYNLALMLKFVLGPGLNFSCQHKVSFLGLVQGKDYRLEAGRFPLLSCYSVS